MSQFTTNNNFNVYSGMGSCGGTTNLIDLGTGKIKRGNYKKDKFLFEVRTGDPTIGQKLRGLNGKCRLLREIQIVLGQLKPNEEFTIYVRKQL